MGVCWHLADTDHGSRQLNYLHKEIDKSGVGGGKLGEEGWAAG